MKDLTDISITSMQQAVLKTNIKHPEQFNRVLNHARQVCQKQGTRLTELREQVLKLVWDSPKPIGAYQLMELLEQNSEREKVAPPTVYRALDFLMEHGLIHKIHSHNTYLACCSPIQKHGEIIFICDVCGSATEVPNSTIQQSINLSASQYRFEISAQILEIKGRCASCRPRNTSRPSEPV